MTELVLVITTAPDEAVANRIADDAIAARLAACAQVHGPIRSTFRWQGTLDHATEWTCHLKTTRALVSALTALIRARHPYELPEIIAVPILAGHAPYLAWVEQSVLPEPPSP